MSILIKDMDMPKGCAVCPYCDRNWSKPKCHAKSVKGRYMAQKLFLDSRRQGWCPLEEFSTAKKGKWIKGIGENGVNTSLYCDQCGYENGHWYEWNFCPNCGAQMEGNDEHTD